MDALAGYGSDSSGASDASGSDIEEQDRYDEADGKGDESQGEDPDHRVSAEPLNEREAKGTSAAVLPSLDDLFSAPLDSISKVRPARDSGIQYFSGPQTGVKRKNTATGTGDVQTKGSSSTAAVDRAALDREAKEYIQKVMGPGRSGSAAAASKPAGADASEGAAKTGGKNAAKDELTAKVIIRF